LPTRPNIGGNLYAIDRIVPEVPYKPNSAEDKQEEDLRALRAEAAEKERLRELEDP